MHGDLMRISPQKIRQLAELSFMLEPILNKADCTTRFIDLPERPITDFLIAGVNAGGAVEKYADSVIHENNRQMFSHFYEALAESNKYKTKKYINVGLLEF